MELLKESSPPAAKEVDIRLGDQVIRVKTNVTPAKLKAIKSLVELKYEALEDKAGHALSARDLLLLVGFNLAEELLDERSRTTALKDLIAEKSERLIARVESLLDLNK